MDHGSVSWLSNDIRVFKLQPLQYFPNTSVQLGRDPIAFIQSVLHELRSMLTPRTLPSREKEIQELVRDVWARRIAILVIVEKDNQKEPESIVLPADL